MRGECAHDGQSLTSSSIARGLGSSARSERLAMARRLRGAPTRSYYGALCDVLSDGRWQARGNAAFLLGEIQPPSEAWRHEAIGRLRHRVFCEPRSEVKGVVERAKRRLEAAAPRDSASATPRRPREAPSRPRGRREPDPWPVPEPNTRHYTIDSDGSIIWL
jgi:hypothetical protein